MSIADLAEQWREDQRAYPDHIGGKIAAAAVRCCANELDNVLAGQPRDASGIATDMATGEQPIDVIVAMSKLLSLEGDDTAAEVKARARAVAAAFCRARGIEYRFTAVGERLVDALAAAGLLAGGDAAP